MKRFQVGLLALGLMTGGYGVAIRQRWLPREPTLLAVLVGVLLVGVAVLLGALAAQVARRRVAPVRGIAAVLALGGVLLVGGGGLANWAWSVQGTLLLFEGDTVPLVSPSHFAGFEAGPLLDARELAFGLRLDKLELVAEGPRDFSPQARVSVLTPEGTVTPRVLSPRQSAAFGPLFFHQGAFGFAPRIVLTRGTQTLFSERVPFYTVTPGAGLARFECTFTVEKEGLQAVGAIDLSGLDDQMKGHVTLELELKRGEAVLGHGRLQPGHFADLQDGTRVGFVELSRWSEVVVSRRTYRAPVLVGLGLAGVGTLTWLAAVLVGRRRRA